MNNQELIQANKKDQDKMKERRQKFDLQDNVETDLYGGKKAKNDFENFDEDVFGGDDLQNDPGY